VAADDDKPVMFIETNVIASSGDDVAVNGGYETFATLAKQWGFRVNHGLHTELHDDFLDTIDVYVLPATDLLLLADDKEALRRFIRNGGGLFVLSLSKDRNPQQDFVNLNGFVKEFGISYGNSVGTNANTRLANIVAGSKLTGPETFNVVESPESNINLKVENGRAEAALVFNNSDILCA
jgi:hypothetical protein